jgi:type IV pilus assembly protein PilW
MCADRPTAAARSERGITLVEIMVGMVVALIIGLAASGSARVFGASQRQGIAAGAMTANAGSALSALKADVASGGLGFFGESTFLCHKLDFSVGPTAKMNEAVFSPVLVTAVGASDRLDVVYSSNVDGGANVMLDSASDGTSAQVMSRLPAAVGQAVLLAPATPGLPCLVRTVTAVTAVTDTSPLTLTFATTGTHNQVTFANPPAFAQRDRIAVLGALRWSRYRLDGSDLKIESPMDGTSAVLLREVISFRVQYGVSASSGTGTLASWENAAGAYASVSGTTVDRVRALRVGIVTRSAQREKENSATGTCEASTDKPKDPFDAAIDLDPGVADWRCYRYRTATVIVPLRNLVW